MTDIYQCNTCNQEFCGDDHDCPGSPDARITRLECSVAVLEDVVERMVSVLDELGMLPADFPDEMRPK